MNCCAVYNSVFNEKYAQKDLETYRKRGLPKESEQFVELIQHYAANKSLLEVGCGLGTVSLALLKNGAESALAIDLSQAYLTRGKLLAKEIPSSTISFRQADIISFKDAKKDIVLADKVVCCYPNYRTFLDALAKNTKETIGLVYPREPVIFRAVVKIVNQFIQIIPRFRGFRFYIHSHKDMHALLLEKNFRVCEDKKKGLWRITLFRREQ